MKIPTLFPRKKMRATIARRSIALPDDMEHEFASGESEPNMKLSRALLIVLVLHVVAVAGIIAFNTIKPRQASVASTPTSATPQPAKSENATAAASAAPSVAKPKPSRAPEQIIAKIGPRVEKAKPVEKPSAAPAGGRTYVVEKGDNPLKIAKKFHVPFDELLAVNHIDNPRKLKVGQKLIIPAKKAAPSSKGSKATD